MGRLDRGRRLGANPADRDEERDGKMRKEVGG
jgi:hypothetical protein